jgi:hypothetical protein
MLEAEREATTAAMSNTQEELERLRSQMSTDKRMHQEALERTEREHARCAPTMRRTVSFHPLHAAPHTHALFQVYLVSIWCVCVWGGGGTESTS